jgi:hypothetical protein
MLVSRDFSVTKDFDSSAVCLQLYMLSASHDRLNHSLSTSQTTATATTSLPPTLFAVVCADLQLSALSSTHAPVDKGKQAKDLKKWKVGASTDASALEELTVSVTVYF